MSPRSCRALASLGIALVVCCRVLPQPFARVLGRPEGELRQHLWVSWALAEETWRDATSPLVTELAAFPGEMRMVPLDPLTQFLTVALTPLGGTIFATNLTLLLHVVLLAYAGARLAAALGGGRVTELCGMLLAVSAPAAISPWADTLTEGLGVGWWLLLLAELLDPNPRGHRVAIYACALLGSSVYLAHGSAPIFVGLFLWRRVRWGWAVPIVAAAVLVGGLLAWGEGGETGQLTERERVVAHAASVPPRTVPRGAVVPEPIPDTGVARHLGSVYPAAIETGPRRAVTWSLVALAAAALVLRRDRGSACLALGSLTYAALAWGSNGAEPWTLGPLRVPLPTPYDLFWRYYPLARYAWKPAWHAIPATLLAVALVIRAAPRLPALGGALREGRRRDAVLGTAVAVVVLETTLLGPAPLPLPASGIVPREVWPALALESGGAVLEFPCRDRWVSTEMPPVADVLLGPLFHGRALAEAFDHPPSRTALDLLSALDRIARTASGMQLPPVQRDTPTLPQAVAAARAAGFGDVLVLGAILGDPATQAVNAALTAAGMVPRDPPEGGVFEDGVSWFSFNPRGEAPGSSTPPAPGPDRRD